MKMPCRRCGRMVAATRSGRHAHKCPHGMECYPNWAGVCQECKKNWEAYREPAALAEREDFQRIARQSKRD